MLFMNSFSGRWNFNNSWGTITNGLLLYISILMLMKLDILYCLGLSVKNTNYLVVDKRS